LHGRPQQSTFEYGVLKQLLRTLGAGFEQLSVSVFLRATNTRIIVGTILLEQQASRRVVQYGVSDDDETSNKRVHFSPESKRLSRPVQPFSFQIPATVLRYRSHLKSQSVLRLGASFTGLTPLFRVVLEAARTTCNHLLQKFCLPRQPGSAFARRTTQQDLIRGVLVRRQHFLPLIPFE
jgi:hypothetical protein